MTIEELVYKFYFDHNFARETVFRLYPKGSNISKAENRRSLWKGAPSQPVDLYTKNVVKFWVEKATRSQVVINVLYE